MVRLMMMAVATVLSLSPLAVFPANAQQQSAPPAPAQGATQVQSVKDVPMARLMSDGAQVRGADSKDRIILQLGKYVFACRAADGKPTLCDLIP